MVYESSPFFSCELSGLNRIAFAVADDPFYKSERAKYYPECIIISRKGKVIAKVNPYLSDNEEFQHRLSEKYGVSYSEGGREPYLKLNDDRKVKIALSKLAKEGRMVLFTVRCFDLRKSPPKEGEFDRAWFRINNEDTN